MDFGAVVITFAVAGFLLWAAYLLTTSRTKDLQPEETPQNLAPYVSDDELENNRLTRILASAVVAAAALAAVMAVYYIAEADRQAEAVEAFHERDVEEGEHWYEHFSCIECHAAGGVGGGAEYIEARSGLTTTWAAPSLNDIFYRYSEEEVVSVIVFGRQGTPMPAAGLEGGGAMTSQEVDQTIAYLRSIQIPQAEAVAKVESAVSQAVNRISSGADGVQARIAEQDEEIADIEAAPGIYSAIADLPVTIDDVLAGAETCTEASAELVSLPCDDPAVDTDRDGISDDAERRLNVIAARAFDAVGSGSTIITLDGSLELSLAADDAFSMADATGEPIADLESVSEFLRLFGTAELSYRIAAERQDRFLPPAEAGLAYLEESSEAAEWEVDFETIADVAFGGDIDDATRAVGLFNSYCARCHTAGYSAGVAFQQDEGSGAWGPALTDGRMLVQFPDIEEHIDFIINGANWAENYGVNGLGSGRMPGFGQLLSREDIELIVKYERSM
ncbi:MAG: cytochrome c [Acidimicrobiia bacterium]|nr:cytochrome c [Acidimicrobiia bacterium]NNC75034.1 cytochrome c [Acidimicrobiia bacterium]